MRRHPTEDPGPTEEQLADLVTASSGGDPEAWAQLWCALAPYVEKIAGSGRVTGELSRDEVERARIVDRVMGELREDRFRLLGELGARLARRDGSYLRWFLTVAMNSARDHVRSHPHYLGVREGEGGRWALFLPLDEEQEGERPDPTRLAEAHAIMAVAEKELTPAQLDALGRWLGCEDCAGIAAALDLEGGAGAGKRLLRSAIKRLRDRFAAPRTGTKKIDRCG